MTPSPPSASPAPRTEVVRILEVADRGAALGRLGGKVVFVPFAAPGDLAEVSITRERARYLEGHLVRVLEPSALRRPARCPVFGSCGGCQWQHLPYRDQWDGKSQAFEGFLRSRLGLSADRFAPPITASKEWGYRNRVSLKVRRSGEEVALGFFEKATHRLVPLRACPVLTPALEATVTALRAELQAFSAADLLAQIDLQQDSEAQVWAVLHAWRAPARRDVDALRGLARRAGLAGTHLQCGRKVTLDPLLDAPIRLPLRIHAGSRELALGLTPGGFTQANDGVNQALVDVVTSLAGLYRGRPALDLYCGAGNFTLPLGLEAARVVGVEGYPPAAADAQHNARANGLTNVRVVADAAERGLTRLEAEGYRPAFALLDPPREGAGEEAVRRLTALGPEHLLYISCSPPTLVRDLGVLAAAGFRVEWVRAVDLFPQTAHVESLTLLHRPL